MRGFLIIASGLTALSCSAASPPSNDALSPAQMSDVTRLGDLSIPSPGECFSAINRFDRPSWSQLIRTPAPPSSTNRAELALLLGTRVADGFIAVEAQDGQRVKNIGRDIISLAKSLGITQSILARGNSISDFAENNEWNSLKEELEATENEVKLAMASQKDEDLVSLVTIGAWLRGTQAASDVVATNFSPAAGSLLRQPAVAEILRDKINALPERIRKETVVEKTRVGLNEIYAILIAAPPTGLDEPAVQSVRTLTTALVEAIAPAAPSAPPAS